MEHVESAIRLSPSTLARVQYMNVLAVGHFYLGNDRKALEPGRLVIQTFDTWAPRMLADLGSTT